MNAAHAGHVTLYLTIVATQTTTTMICSLVHSVFLDSQYRVSRWSRGEPEERGG